jgi:hypothetical protein
MKWMQWEKDRLRLTATALLVSFVVTACPGIAWIPSAMAAAQQDLERAQDLYDFAEFQQALDLVTGLIEGGQLTETEMRNAYILRARSSIGLGLNAQAREDFCSVYKIDSSWKPDPVIFPKDEIDVFNSAIAGCKVAATKPAPSSAGKKSESKPWYMKPVTWVAGGAVILAAVVLGGGSDDGGGTTPAATLEDFPDPPTN